MYYYRRVSSTFAKVLAANYANYANGPQRIPVVTNGINGVRSIRVIRAIRGSDFGCGFPRCGNSNDEKHFFPLVIAAV